MKKQEIRKLYRAKRNDLPPAEKLKLEDLMLINFQSLHLNIPDAVMSFSPIAAQNEYDPLLIEDHCFFKNPATTLIYPVMNAAETDLRAIAVKDDTVFERNEFGVDEPVNGTETDPQAAGLILIPLIAFDARGYRVGFGKGYYDRFLKRCRADALRVGFSFFDPVVIDDVHDADEKLDFCITPFGVHSF